MERGFCKGSQHGGIRFHKYSWGWETGWRGKGLDRGGGGGEGVVPGGGKVWITMETNRGKMSRTVFVERSRRKGNSRIKKYA